MLISTEYKHTGIPVNKFVCLIGYKPVSNLCRMKYGDRLVLARKQAKLTQAELAEKSGASQQTISYLENGDATGSEFTVQFAEACEVRPQWLAMEQGDMVDGMVIEGERLKHLFMVCEKLPDYAVDQLVQQSDALVELIEKARKNGTEHAN